MINLGFEWDNGGFEREVLELELDFELSSFEGGLLRTCNEDFPQTIVFDNDVDSSDIN